MNAIFSNLGDKLARYLTKPLPNYETFHTLTLQQLKDTLQPGDLLLVEGNSRISVAIKYLTQSTWSHVAMFIGEQEGFDPLLEADVVNGVSCVPLSKYEGFNVRVCRPINLTEEDGKKLLRYVVDRIGLQYDTKNIFDLMRYLIPTPPIPSRFRRSLITFGSGDPTKAICSTLVAQAFQSIHYPILPSEVRVCTNEEDEFCDDVFFEKKHYSYFTPRDFDLSPYFDIVKPTIEASFDYRKLKWQETSASD
jgi:hypothetical protein